MQQQLNYKSKEPLEKEENINSDQSSIKHYFDIKMLKVYKTLTMKNCKALHKLMKTYVNIDTIFVDGKTQYYRHVDLL